MVREPKVESAEQQDDPDIGCQSLPELMPEESHVNADDNGD